MERSKAQESKQQMDNQGIINLEVKKPIEIKGQCWKNNLNGSRTHVLIEVGTMHRPMLKYGPPAAHIIIPSLLVALAFCLFAVGMTSPSTQVSTNVEALNSFELTSGMKASNPLAFCFLLTPSTFKPSMRSEVRTPLVLMSLACQPSSNAMRGTPK